MSKKYKRDTRSSKSLTIIGAIALISVVVLFQVWFLTMKLSGAVDWNWFVVLLPVILAGGFYLICTMIDLITIGVQKMRNRNSTEKVIRSRK